MDAARRLSVQPTVVASITNKSRRNRNFHHARGGKTSVTVSLMFRQSTYHEQKEIPKQLFPFALAVLCFTLV